MASTVPEGHVGNLTPEHEAKLRELWATVFKLYDALDSDKPVLQKAPTPKETPKKKGWFGFGKEAEPAPSTTSNAALEALNLSSSTEDDKFGLVKQFQQVLAKESPESIRKMLLQAVKHEHPDALVLRFLRARKWDIKRAIVMMFSAMDWRHSQAKVDQDIMTNGEEIAVRDSEKGEVLSKTLAADFLKQIRMGKSFVHGVDRENRPISVVRVRLHKASDQCVESIERYTTYLIETSRLALTPPVETATLIFDMTGFTLANMDYVPVKFIIKCFEANYPESLGAIHLHNAPWVFKGIWKIIHGWLDPVVAAKVHFTYGREGLEEFIAPDQLIKELGGDEDWEYKYEEPIPGENDKMKDTETRDRLLKERDDIINQFETATREWVKNPEGDAGQQIQAKRVELANQLRDNYFKVDPYVRCRSLYDRLGNLLPGGGVKWYPDSKAAAEPAATSQAVDEKTIETTHEEVKPNVAAPAGAAA